MAVGKGTRVANAYVAITADGSRIPKDLADSFKKFDADKAGDDIGKKMSKALDRHLVSIEKQFNSSMKKVGKAIEIEEAIEVDTARVVAKAFDDGKFRAAVKDIGRRTGADMIDGFDKHINTALAKSIEKAVLKASRNGKVDMSAILADVSTGTDGDRIRLLGPAFDEALKEIEQKVKKHAETRLKVQEDLNKDLHKAEIDRIKAVVANAKALGREIAEVEEAIDAEQRSREKQRDAGFRARLQYEASVIKVREALQKDANKEAHRLEIDRLKTAVANAKDLGREIAEVEKAIDADQRSREKQRDAAAKARFQYERMLRKGQINARTGELIESRRGPGLGDRIGAALGQGSRMDGIHYIGASAAVATKAVMGLASAGSALGKAFSGADGGAGGIGGVVSTLGKSAASAGPLVLALGAASVGLVSVLAALSGGVAAVASTIASGLVGALTAAGAAVGALAIQAGLLTLAFTSMTDSQVAYLSAAFTPVKEGFTGLGQLILEDMVPAFEQWGENVEGFITLIAPLASVMSSAFAQAGNTLTAALTGPGFQRLAEMATAYLPGITAAFSQAAAGFANGLAGLLAGLMPALERVGGYISDIAERFSNWASSAEGQNAIVDFADRALDSLSSLWGFVTQFAGLIKDVLFSPEAQEFGNSIFDSLARAFEGFREKISSGVLEQWFNNAAKMGSGLWSVMQGIGSVIGALMSSNAVAILAGWFQYLGEIFKTVGDLLGPVIDLLGPALSGALNGATTVIQGFVATLKTLWEGLKTAVGWIPGVDVTGSWDNVEAAWSGVGSAFESGREKTQKEVDKSAKKGIRVPNMPNFDFGSLQNLGRNALLNTSEDRGGYKANPSTRKPKKPEYVNPYTEWANSLIVEPSAKKVLRDKVKAIAKDARATVKDALKSTDGAGTREDILGQRDAFKNLGKDIVSAAQSGVNSAATTLANASSPEAAAKALKNLKKAQKELKAAQKEQKALNIVAGMLSVQAVKTGSNVRALMEGKSVETATLADYARARELMAEKLEKAKEKLAEAIDLRDTYRNAVMEGVKSFGSLVTTQAKVIDGVEQKLTSSDIVKNMRGRLEQARTFMNDMRILASQGLNATAYQQIIDMGVEEGSKFATALREGGAGAIWDVNQLTSAFDGIADTIGKDSSSTLFQAGVDAAQGVLKGLTSINDQIEQAAFGLGEIINKAIKKALGIKSPSRVMIAAMGDVGAGIEQGLDQQHPLVASASTRLSKAISITPSVDDPALAFGIDGGPEQAATGGASIINHWSITGFSEDPRVAAKEMINEMTGRLG